MTERCADLDEYFDGELAADQAARFCDHLADCERCQDVLHGRMQERMITQLPAAQAEPARAPVAAAPGPVASTSEAALARARDRRGEPARRSVCVRALAYAAPLLAAAAAVPLYLAHRGDPDLELAVAADRAPGTVRSDPAAGPPRILTVQSGGSVRPTVRGARHRAIWVYGEHGLVVACPGDARCKADRGELTLELAPIVRGKYDIVALGSQDPLPTPGTTLDQTLVLARRAGIRTELRHVDVE